MGTVLKYLEDSYIKEWSSVVTAVAKDEVGNDYIELEETILYPQGGGQPSDTGTIESESAKFKVTKAVFDDGVVKHLGTYENGELKVGDKVQMHIDWDRRYLDMKLHTAGHLIDVAQKNLGLKMTPAKGYHFPDGPYVEYVGDIPEGKREEVLKQLQAEVSRIISAGLDLMTKIVTKEELSQYCDYVPDYLPAGKPVRIVKVGDFPAHPCGGTHVKNTSEIGNMVIEKLKSKGGNTRVNYNIGDVAVKVEEKKEQKVHENITATSGQIKEISEFVAKVDSADLKDIVIVKAIREELTSLMKKIPTLPNEQKGQYGREINQAKTYLEEKIAAANAVSTVQTKTEKVDVTAPYDINTPVEKRPKLYHTKGHQHPLYQELENILRIFEGMGFNVMDSRQLDDDYHMFESLNFPLGHPARDMYDSLWTDEGFTPPAQTSTMQNRILRSSKPPIRYVIPGMCYRNEATDASHEHTFFQIEGVYVDKGISFADMAGTIKTYLEAFFNTHLEHKVKSGFFPFVEPGAEFAISCPFCQKKGCAICGYNGWIEVMGCGMIHPNVLREGGIDPKVYSGFAWGFGLDRLVMIKNGIKDVRRLRNGDLEFLQQF